MAARLGCVNLLSGNDLKIKVLYENQPTICVIVVDRFAYGLWLVACGGGSGEVVTVASSGSNIGTLPEIQTVYIDKYVGVWTTACLTDSGINESGRFISTITKKSSFVLTVALTATRVAGKNCTGTALPAIFHGNINDITYADTVNDVDRFSYSGNGKSTSKIVGLALNVGNEMKLDAAGYPVIDVNDLATAFIKN